MTLWQKIRAVLRGERAPGAPEIRTHEPLLHECGICGEVLAERFDQQRGLCQKCSRPGPRAIGVGRGR